jgi:hypothetical protein
LKYPAHIILNFLGLDYGKELIQKDSVHKSPIQVLYVRDIKNEAKEMLVNPGEIV